MSNSYDILFMIHTNVGYEETVFSKVSANSNELRENYEKMFNYTSVLPVAKG